MKKVEVLKRTYHLISQSKNGKKAMIVILDHLSNGKYASQTCHAVLRENGEWGLLLVARLGLGVSIPTDKVISGMGRIHESVMQAA